MKDETTQVGREEEDDPRGGEFSGDEEMFQLW